MATADRQVITQYFENLEHLDLDGFLALWDERAVQLMPFAPPGTPTRIEGKDAIRRQYGNMAEAFSHMRFRDLDVQELKAPGEFFARFHGDLRLKNGHSYDNDYASRFVVRHGKLVEVDEYSNPLALQEAFGPGVTAGSEALAVRRVVESIFQGTDSRDWGLVAGAFAREAVIDDGTPDTLTPQGVVNRWRPLFSELTATEHALREVEVKVAGPRAHVASAFGAWHLLRGAEGGDEWMLEGRYVHELESGPDGWKVTHLKMSPGAQEGNARLLEIARERARAKAPSNARPFGLRAVTSERVTFGSQWERLKGILYRPVTVPNERPRPAIIVAGTWTSVKEQMTALYAARLAEHGFITLAFDFRGYGESEGFPREVERPEMKIEDVRSGVRFLETLPNVDAERIGALGVCTGAGYVAGACVDEASVRSLAIVAPWLHDPELVRGVYGGEEGVALKIAQASRAETAFIKTGIVQYVPAASATNPDAAMPMAMDYYENPRRGRVPEWGNRFAVMAWRDWLTFNPIAFAPHVSVPVQMVHSESAAIPEGARRFYAGLRGPKSLLWTDGLQFDFYDQPGHVDFAAELAAEHFRKTLG